MRDRKCPPGSSRPPHHSTADRPGQNGVHGKRPYQRRNPGRDGDGRGSLRHPGRPEGTTMRTLIPDPAEPPAESWARTVHAVNADAAGQDSALQGDWLDRGALYDLAAGALVVMFDKARAAAPWPSAPNPCSRHGDGRARRAPTTTATRLARSGRRRPSPACRRSRSHRGPAPPPCTNRTPTWTSRTA